MCYFNKCPHCTVLESSHLLLFVMKIFRNISFSLLSSFVIYRTLSIVIWPCNSRTSEFLYWDQSRFILNLLIVVLWIRIQFPAECSPNVILFQLYPFCFSGCQLGCWDVMGTALTPCCFVIPLTPPSPVCLAASPVQSSPFPYFLVLYLGSLQEGRDTWLCASLLHQLVLCHSCCRDRLPCARCSSQLSARASCACSLFRTRVLLPWFA